LTVETVPGTAKMISETYLDSAQCAPMLD